MNEVNVLVKVVWCTMLLGHAGRAMTVIMSDGGAGTDRREQEAVYDIMRGTGNEWATDIADVCRGRWHGIECMPDKDNVFHVVSLSFGALSDDTAFPTCHPTRSFISPSLANLPHLRTLFFYRCLTYNPQPIPSFLGLLGPSLQTLVLRENGHVGPIPLQLSNLTHLRVLDLHNNNLNGSIPLSLARITGLRSLDLSANKLTGPIPAFTFPSLNVLDLSHNVLTGSIPSSIWDSQSLLKLDLSRNRLLAPLPDKPLPLKNLLLLDISYNLIQGPFPVSLKTLTSLEALILKGNPMGSIIPGDAFEGMQSLLILILSNMNLHGPLPLSLATLSGLRVVHLDGNHFNGSIPNSFRDLRRLTELRLNHNRLTGSLPFDRQIVWRMKRKLMLNNNSGLCYDATSGFLDSTFDLGIPFCHPWTPLQHLTSLPSHSLPATSPSLPILLLPTFLLFTILFF
ncbi:hypothetical protein VNO78_14534 [Psophocarpus tetragonolobus]|uniref:Uncharacterized protein n=1 Tax=Psophocarpus tetragonolobus TaxID=3891 RepID=A0AAN9XQJ5_PSOTE